MYLGHCLTALSGREGGGGGSGERERGWRRSEEGRGEREKGGEGGRVRREREEMVEEKEGN